MIRLSCTNCKTVLSIDDAFAGGVCRCQHCGTIQTVPAQAKRAAATTGAAQAAGGSRALFQHDSRADGAGSGTGLDELANVVASSGLTSSGLSSRRLTRPVPPTGNKHIVPLLIGVGVIIVVLLLVIVWLAMRTVSGNLAANTQRNSRNSGEGAVAAAGASPNFCGIPVEGSTVAYVLDRGSATKEIFPALQDATVKSLESLGPDRRFQVIFWDNGSEDAAYPPASATYATKENIDSARRMMEGAAVFGSTNAGPSLKKAVAIRPDLIFLVSAKGWQLDQKWAEEMTDAVGSASTRIDTISLGVGGSGGPSEGLKALSAKTGGKYVQVGEADLKVAGQ